MTQIRRTVLGILALAVAVAVFVGQATRATWAQAIDQDGRSHCRKYPRRLGHLAGR